MIEARAIDAATAADIRQLKDRAAIHDLLVRYFAGADSADKALVRSCFTEDVQAQYEGRPRADGLDILIDQIATFTRLPSGAMTICTHFMGNLRYRKLAADEAETETHAFAFLVMPGGVAGQVQMRSARYLDRLVRVDGEWKIASRVHTLDWSCAVPADFARAFAQKRTGLLD